VNIADPQEKDRIYQRYLRAFKKGVYNIIKEEVDPLTQEEIPRKYFSGGFKLNVRPVITIADDYQAQKAVQKFESSDGALVIDAGLQVSSILNGRQFSGEGLRDFVGTGKLAVSAADGKNLAWLPLTDHITVSVVNRDMFEQAIEQREINYLVPDKIIQEGDEPVYHYTLPEGLTVRETLDLINSIRGLALSDDEKKLIIPQVPRNFINTAVYLANRFQAKEDMKMHEVIKTYYALGVILGGETTDFVVPQISEIARGYDRTLENEVIQWLGLDTAGIRDADRLLERATALAVQGVQIQLESLTYWRGVRLLKKDLRLSRFPRLNILLTKAGLKKIADKVDLLKPLPKNIDLADRKNRIGSLIRSSETEQAALEEIEGIEFILGSIRKLPGWVKQKGKFMSISESSPAIGRLTNELNCLGRSALTALYLQDLGISNDRIWSVSVSGHMFLMVQLSDGRYFWVEPSRNPSYSRIASLPLGNSKIPAKGINLDLKKELGIDFVMIEPWREGTEGNFYANLAATLYDAQYYEAAAATILKGITMKPNSPFLYFLLGDILRELGSGRRKDSEAAYRMSIKLNPKDADTYLRLGEILLMKRMVNNEVNPEAIQEFRKSVKINPKNAKKEVSRWNISTSKPVKGVTVAELIKGKDSAMNGIENTGGIDLTPANMNLQMQNKGGEIIFTIDPAKLAQLQNAPGFLPVIINIRPMTNLGQFLGLNDQQRASTVS
jgi:tetratricopeptide (TPR) repeat protein